MRCVVLLVERRRELGLLDTLFAEADAGRGQVALVDGVVASGKTELLRTFAEQRGDGVVTLATGGARSQRYRPFGSIRPLVSALPLASSRTEALLRHLDGRDGNDPTASHTFDVAHSLLQLVLEVSENAPLLITLDDAQHIDAQSMECVLHIANHIRSARVMLLLAEAAYGGSISSGYRIELIRQANFRRLSLALLSPDGVKELLEQHVDPSVAHQHASACHAVSAGNPLLVRALVEDQPDEPHAMSVVGPQRSPSVGDTFRQAVMTCLERSGHGVVDIAQAIAVLGRDCTVDRVGSLLGQRSTEVERAFRTLRLAGCLGEREFKDSLFRQAVLDSIELTELARLHRSAASVIHAAEVDIASVAGHLVAAGGVPDEWAVTRLMEAAEAALRADAPDRAIEYLEHALAGCGHNATGTKLRLLLLGAHWRANPSHGIRHVARLSPHRYRGELDVEQSAILLRLLLWEGRIHEVRTVLDRLSDKCRSGKDTAGGSLEYTGAWLRHTCPELAERWAELNGESDTATEPEPSPASWWTKASVALHAVLTGTPDGSPAANAESVLQATALGDRTIEPVWHALWTLIHADRLDSALQWCDPLLAEAKARKATWWEAMFSACRAEIALRYGELPVAARYASRALSIAGTEGWGIGIGQPLSVLMNVGTATADHDAVQDHLRQDVPAAMFRTGYCLPYLRARGRYYLANEWWDAALEDFHHCGELTAQWGFEAPALAPWRTDAAEVYLRLGEPARARELAEEQLDRVGKSSPRARGVALRIIATTLDDVPRLRLLKDTVELLQASGDRLELAHALFELSRAHQALGQSAKARMVSHRGSRLVQACRMETSCSEVEPSGKVAGRGRSRSVASVPSSEAARRTTTKTTAQLTPSEQRVAALAAVGYTNREISARLHITVSTVEQHLTKIFRKLRVTRRTDLPADLPLGVEEPGKPSVKPLLSPPTMQVAVKRRSMTADTA